MVTRATKWASFVLPALVYATGPTVQAQWTATRLHNPAFGTSLGFAGSGDWQGGNGAIGQSKPILWHSSSGQWANLAPGPGDGGIVFGMHGNRQVGQFNGYAALWSGTPESRVDLNPAWSQWSIAWAAWGDEQVGRVWAGPGYPGEAALWRGSAASFVSLHPEGLEFSEAAAVAAGQQGGQVWYPNGPTHAALWSGTAASFVDLNPPGASGSVITGMAPGQQVGYASALPAFTLHAAMWSGTPESFVDLHPAAAGFESHSQAYGTCGSAQVGYVMYSSGNAVIWFGSPESVVKLHDFLPPGQYSQSEARAVAIHNGRYYVAGTAKHVAGGNEAWLWVGGCYADCNRDGRLTVPDFTCFQNKFVAADPYADCTGDGNRTVADFTCFQSAFVAGCR